MCVFFLFNIAENKTGYFVKFYHEISFWRFNDLFSLESYISDQPISPGVGCILFMLSSLMITTLLKKEIKIQKTIYLLSII